MLTYDTLNMSNTAYTSPMQQQRAANLAGWQKNHPDYKVCPKCKGDGVSVTKARRHYSTCSQCGGSGWKFAPKETK